MEPLIVVMGVSGSGKSTVGVLLAAELAVPFLDADDLHSDQNVALMSSGVPLDDGLRMPWLRRVGQALSDAGGSGLVVACSALRRVYRDTILGVEPGTRFVLLDAPAELLRQRLAGREGHFMPPELLDSQLATLEPLERDEPGVTVSAEGLPALVAAEAREKLGLVR